MYAGVAVSAFASLAYAAILTAIVAGCWFAGGLVEKALPHMPWLIRRMAYLLLNLAMVQGLLRFLS